MTPPSADIPVPEHVSGLNPTPTSRRDLVQKKVLFISSPIRDHSAFPKQHLPLNIILLTHSREISKPSNTGKLALDALGSSARRVIWERTQPDQWLMEHIKQQPTALLFPSDDHQAETEVSLFESYIVIDSTWQEARKIYNHSPYLKELPKLSLKPVGKSKFSLRRNQLENGLCTAECVEEILKQRGQQKLASLLNERFLAFIEQSRKS